MIVARFTRIESSFAGRSAGVAKESRERSAGLVAVVTGASSGIGRSLAVRLGAAGYRVGLIARRRDELEAVTASIAAAGGAAVAAVADVGDRAALRGAVALVDGRFGPVDVMVANAGFGAPTRLDPLNTADVEQTMRVNVLGVIYSVEAVLPGMLARRRGHLLAVSSLAAFKGLPGESAYCASKAAVNAYMEGLRIALRKKGVVVTTICPGFVQTPMTPMDSATPFMISADAAAGRIARLIVGRRGGVHRFPLLDVALDVADRPASRCGSSRGWSRVEDGPLPAGTEGAAMIDLALKMLLDEKARFAAHGARCRLCRGAGAGAGRSLLRPARERQHHDRSARCRPVDHCATRRTSTSAIRSPRAMCSGCVRCRAWRGPTT